MADGTVDDVSKAYIIHSVCWRAKLQTKILYGLPLAVNKISDFAALRDEISTHGAVIRILIDHPGQVLALEQFEKEQVTPRKWSAFIKVDGGQK